MRKLWKCDYCGILENAFEEAISEVVDHTGQRLATLHDDCMEGWFAHYERAVKGAPARSS